MSLPRICWLMVLGLGGLPGQSSADDLPPTPSPLTAMERWRGWECVDRKDYDGAIAHFTKVLQVVPDDVAALIDRGKAYGKKDGKEDEDRALADLNRAIELDPKNAAAWAQRGTIWRDERDDSRVGADCDEAIRLDPALAAPHLTRAQTYLIRSDFDHAWSDLEEAVRLGANDPDLFTTRAVVRLMRDDPRGAITDLDRVMQAKPEPAWVLGAWWLRGIAHCVAGEFEAALGDYDQILKFAPQVSDAVLFRAQTLVMLGRYPEAWQTFDALVAANPGKAWFLASRAAVATKQARFADAVVDLDAALASPPDQVQASFLVQRGYIAMRQHRYDRALADCERAVAWDPNRLAVSDKADALAMLASIWSTCPEDRFRDGPKAVAAGTRACELSEWKDANALACLAAAHAEVGHFDQAIRYVQDALRVPPAPCLTWQAGLRAGSFGVQYHFPPVDRERTRQLREEALAGYHQRQAYRDTR